MSDGAARERSLQRDLRDTRESVNRAREEITGLRAEVAGLRAAAARPANGSGGVRAARGVAARYKTPLPLLAMALAAALMLYGGLAGASVEISRAGGPSAAKPLPPSHLVVVRLAHPDGHAGLRAPDARRARVSVA